MTEGIDLTSIIRIQKYHKPLPEGSEALGPFPDFLRKTDEPDLMTRPNMVTAFNGKVCYITMKMDGQSGTYFVNKGDFGVCSRNLQLKDTPNNVFWNMARKYDIEKAMRDFAGNGAFALQAEVFGPGIQGNKCKVDEKQIMAFNLFDIETQQYFSAGQLRRFCEFAQINMVRTIWSDEFRFDLKQLQDLANNTKYDSGAPAEGIVIRPVTEAAYENERLSAKVISEVFTSKHGE